MFSTKFEVFIPGRLCILGEHTDWAAEHKHQNPQIQNGFTLVCATNEGLHATVSEHDNFTLKFEHLENGTETVFESKFDEGFLQTVAKDGDFYCYVAGTALAVLRSDKFRLKFPQYSSSCSSDSSSSGSSSSVPGIHINNHKTTLPMKKGLSSSASVCVLVVSSFNQLYDLQLRTEEIMELAYLGEMNTPSQCGRMDQCVVMGQGSVGVMQFDNTKCVLTKLKCRTPLHFVVVDLKASKDTMVILRDLNECFPVPNNTTQALMHEYVSENVAICASAVSGIEAGDVSIVAQAMTAAQTSFDRCAAPNCVSQLTSPVLHSVMGDEYLRSASLAIKGVGSQGDGSVQFLCKDETQQSQVLEHIRSNLHMDGFQLTIPAETADV